jgi:XRE family transcriptional regulator, aerobic/anaerobic benzoate catabolism transcriptional regulator
MEHEPLLHQIGRRIRDRRTSMGWTLREIAERSGISPRFLCDVEAGKGNISVARLADVAMALDVSIVSLMSPAEEKRVIALVGLRGAGKSTVGKALAKRLRVRFVELDALIETDTNLSLGELFALHGEAYYKRRAYDLLVKLVMQNEPMVIATGGSIVTDAESWQLLKRRTHTVWLKASPENHWKRVLGQGDTRPMANRASAKAEMRSILSLRSPLYSEAAQTIDTNSLGVREAVRIIDGTLRDKGMTINSRKETPKPKSLADQRRNKDVEFRS